MFRSENSPNGTVFRTVNSVRCLSWGLSSRTKSPWPGVAAGMICLVASTGGAAATQDRLYDQDHELVCTQYYPEAEKEFGILPGLLEAIGRVETGHGQTHPDPWALNIGGEAVYAPSKEEAMLRVDTALAEDPDRNVDIGCMQISWYWHRKNASSPSTFLDPRANVFYAGWYLSQLKKEFGTWKDAVGAYHGRKPAVMKKYRCLVYKALLTVERISIRVRNQMRPAIQELCSRRIADQYASINTAPTAEQLPVADRFEGRYAGANLQPANLRSPDGQQADMDQSGRRLNTANQPSGRTGVMNRTANAPVTQDQLEGLLLQLRRAQMRIQDLEDQLRQSGRGALQVNARRNEAWSGNGLTGTGKDGEDQLSRARDWYNK